MARKFELHNVLLFCEKTGLCPVHALLVSLLTHLFTLIRCSFFQTKYALRPMYQLFFYMKYMFAALMVLCSIVERQVEFWSRDLEHFASLHDFNSHFQDRGFEKNLYLTLFTQSCSTTPTKPNEECTQH